MVVRSFAAAAVAPRGRGVGIKFTLGATARQGIKLERSSVVLDSNLDKARCIMGLVTKTDTGWAKSAYKKSLKSYGIKDANGKVIRKLQYGFSWNEYEDNDTFVAAKQELPVEKQRKFVNAAAKTTARQAANNAALEAIGIKKPNAESDSQIRLKSVFTGLFAKYVSDGMDKDAAFAKARAKASEMLEEDWDESDEDEDDEE